jgi:hypothetical protein
MIDVDILKSIPESELKNWIKVNGYDESWFDTIYAQWLVAKELVESTE